MTPKKSRKRGIAEAAEPEQPRDVRKGYSSDSVIHASGGRFDYKRPRIVEVCLDLAPPGGILLIRTPAAGRLFGHQFTLRLRLPN